MQAYGRTFARVYNLKWSGFARQVAPLIREFYAATSTGQANRSVLDLCCGAGHLAVHFLENGYRVVGLDLSEAMLQHARANAQPFIDAGQARFVQGDASDFHLEERFGLVVSTYDALNHLQDEQALQRCFACVFQVCEGYFLFDLNTRHGLKRWNNITIDESQEDAVIITRGIYDGHSDKAWTRITGFLQVGNGSFERFEETAYNTVYELEKVKTALFETGWKDAYFAKLQDLKTPISDPEQENRVFVVAHK